MRLDVLENHSFLSDGLGDASVVVDLGLNRGEFARGVHDRYGCRVIGVEPAPALFRELHEAGFVEAHNLAIAGRTGEVSLHLNEGRCASVVGSLREENADAVTVPARSLEDFLDDAALWTVDLIKMDIEGAELEVLAQASPDVLARLQQVTVEFHAFYDRSSRPEVERVVRRLRHLGFWSLDFSFGRLTDVLFVHRDHRPLSVRDAIEARVRFKYPRGLARLAARLTG